MEMTSTISSATVKAAELALRIGSTAADTFSFMADLGEELPVVKPVLSTLKSIREKIDTVKSNREELIALHEKSSYITACFIEKCRGVSSELDVAPLENHVQEMEKFVLYCQQRRGMARRWLKASETKGEIARLNAIADSLKSDMGLEGIAILVGKANEIQNYLVRCSCQVSVAFSSDLLAVKADHTQDTNSWFYQSGQSALYDMNGHKRDPANTRLRIRALF